MSERRWPMIGPPTPAALGRECPVCGNAHTSDVCGSDGCICELIGLP